MVRAAWRSARSLLAAGLWNARALSPSGARAAIWAGWGVAVPLFILFSLWVAFGNLDHDLAHAARRACARRDLRGGRRDDRACRGAAADGRPGRLVRARRRRRRPAAGLHMGFRPGWTTVLLGASSPAGAGDALPAYPVLGWLCVGAVVFVLLRFAIDPTIVGAQRLDDALLQRPAGRLRRTRPRRAFAAWQLARTTDGPPRLVMEAAAELLCADRRGDAGSPRHEWRRHRRRRADAGRAVDLHADRARPAAPS